MIQLYSIIGLHAEKFCSSLESTCLSVDNYMITAQRAGDQAEHRSLSELRRQKLGLGTT